MKKTLKKIIVSSLAGALVLSNGVSALAASTGYGQWCPSADGKRVWFKLTEDGKSFYADTWAWIKDTDGVVRSYHFNPDGYLDTNKIIEGYELDKQGHYIKDGKVVTVTDDDSVDYLTHTDLAILNGTKEPESKEEEKPAVINNFAKPEETKAEETKAEETVPANENNGETVAETAATSEATDNVIGKNTAVEGTKETPTSNAGTIVAAKSSNKSSKKHTTKAVKVSGGGDSPKAVAESTAYTKATVSGKTISNPWAGYTIDLPVNASAENSNSGTDWFAFNGESEIINTYFKLDHYQAGNTSLSAFITKFTADARGFKGAKNVGAVTLGKLGFTKLTKAMSTPTGDLEDAAYIREIPGTGYVQVIRVERNGDTEDWKGALNTLR